MGLGVRTSFTFPQEGCVETICVSGSTLSCYLCFRKLVFLNMSNVRKMNCYITSGRDIVDRDIEGQTNRPEEMYTVIPVYRQVHKVKKQTYKLIACIWISVNSVHEHLHTLSS